MGSIFNPSCILNRVIRGKCYKEVSVYNKKKEKKSRSRNNYNFGTFCLSSLSSLVERWSLIWWRGGQLAWWRNGQLIWLRGGQLIWWRGGQLIWLRGGQLTIFISITFFDESTGYSWGQACWILKAVLQHSDKSHFIFHHLRFKKKKKMPPATECV